MSGHKSRQNDVKSAQQILLGANFPVSFSGAGLSAESGIQTFRGTSHGSSPLSGADNQRSTAAPDSDPWWERFDPQALASPEGFAEAPNTVLAWYHERRRQALTANPNAAHLTLAAQSHWVHITQNVDDLLERAGAPASGVHHLHGTLMADRCHSACGYRARLPEKLSAKPPEINDHQCPNCGSDLRPDVVWFGEALDGEVLQAAQTAMNEADALLVVGTSAVVYPAAGLVIDAQRRGVPVVLVNLEPSLSLTERDVELIGPAGSILKEIFAAND